MTAPTHYLVILPSRMASDYFADYSVAVRYAATHGGTIIPVVKQADGSFRTTWDATTDEIPDGTIPGQ